MVKVLVVTRTKDRSNLLPRAIESILNQSYKNWHHVIVNDGGNIDKFNSVILKYERQYKNRLTVISNTSSVGMEKASNLGIISTKSEYIAIHDDDDTWEQDFLKEMVNTIELSSCDGIVCHVTQIFERTVGEHIEILDKRYFNPDLKKCNISRLRLKNQFLPISFVFTRRAYLSLNGFNESFDVCGDWDFHYRFLQKYKIKVIRKRLANYHVRDINREDSNNINSIKNKALHSKFRQKFLLKHNIKENSVFLQKIYDLTVLRCIRLIMRRMIK